MKIVVLCGGLSPERNVSLSSGTRIAKTLKENGHQVVLTDLYFGLEDWNGSLENIFENPPEIENIVIDTKAPNLEKIKASRKLKSKSEFGDRVIELCQMADIVFMALHGQCGENGKVQAVFDMLGIKYTGSGYMGCAVAMDKDLTKRVVAPYGIKTAKWNTYKCAEVSAEKVSRDMDLPLVVKPDDSGSSIGVSIVNTYDELDNALKSVCNESNKVVIEKYISGREIQVGILGNEALPSIEIITKQGFYDYENKYQAGAAEEITPAPITPEQEATVGKLAVEIYNYIGLQVYSRADFILDEEGTFWFLEINTLPGMTPTSLVPQEAAAVGYSYNDLCEKIIELSLEKYNK